MRIVGAMIIGLTIVFALPSPIVSAQASTFHVTTPCAIIMTNNQSGKKISKAQAKKAAQQAKETKVLDMVRDKEQRAKTKAKEDRKLRALEQAKQEKEQLAAREAKKAEKQARLDLKAAAAAAAARIRGGRNDASSGHPPPRHLLHQEVPSAEDSRTRCW